LRLSWSAWSSSSCRIYVTIPGSLEYSCLINRAALLCTISTSKKIRKDRINWRSAEAQLLCNNHQRLEWSSTGHSRNWWLWGIQDQPHSPQKPVKSHEWLAVLPLIASWSYPYESSWMVLPSRSSRFL
jgi:hypothetical protein